MNPIYRFELSANGTTRNAKPIYSDGLSLDWEREQGQQFYRAKLSGKLTFNKRDYQFIVNAAFDTQFDVVIFISYDNGTTWTQYWRGQFWKTDCEFDGDTHTAVVTPSVKDQYNEILAGLDKEYNLIDLAPEILPIKMDKRPMIQVYVPGSTVIGCFLSGMYWETDCDAVTDPDDLVNDYHFALNKSMRIVEISGSMSPELPDVFMGVPPTRQISTPYEEFEYISGDFKLHYLDAEPAGEQRFHLWTITRISDNKLMWRKIVYSPIPSVQTVPYEVTLTPVSGSGASGNVTIYVHDMAAYARYVTDVVSAMGINTYPIPSNDLVADNRNYSRCTPYYFPNTIWFSDVLSATPTKWGIYQPGQYYVAPSSAIFSEAYPVARASWGRVSLWFTFDPFDWTIERAWRKQITLRDAFPLASAISVLLGKIAPGVTHDGTTDYSQFLYGTNPISGIDETIFIAPKSNLIESGYDEPAKKAMITLQDITTMLRDCFRAFWFIDASGRFRIEHIFYFENGGSYSGEPTIGIDLTTEITSRSGKPWAFARNQYEFNKPEMAARYQFGWMDDSTQLFDGYPIDIISKYVNQDNIENIDIAKFTSDVDYILLNPAEISKDGFVLMGAIEDGGEYILPYVSFYIGTSEHILQNAYMAFHFLQQYYAYDMPAAVYEINGEIYDAAGMKKMRVQTIKFPVLTEPDMFNLIKTEIGNGTIQKMSVNLSSRSATTTLEYDTEQ